MSINLYAVTSSTWARQPEGVTQAITELNAKNPVSGRIVRVDLPQAASVSCGPNAIKVHKIATLVRKTAAQYEPDTEEVMALVSAISRAKESDALIDASAFSADVINKVLAEIREQAFTMDQWPSSLAIVCRDDDIESLIDSLATTFFVMPSRRSIGEASTYAMRVHKAAKYARFFMWSQAATGRAFRLRDKIAKVASALLKRDDTERM